MRPDGGYAPSPLPPWVPVGTTGVIRRAERNSEIVAEREVDVIVIPGELYARAWLRPLRVDELAGATAPARRGTRMTMTTIERVVALHRVDRCSPTSRVGPSPPSPSGRTRSTSPPATLVIAEGAVEDHLFAVVAGRLRVHHGDRTVASLGAGSTVGELAALVPEPRSASVTALEPTMLLRIDKPILDELLADRPALASGVIEALVAMVRERAHAEADTSSA